jgi:hypothetical protein
MGGKKAKSTTKVILDPQTQELNRLRLAQERLYGPLRARGAELVGNVFDPKFTLPTGVSAGYRDLTGRMLPGQDLSQVYAGIPGLSDMKFSSAEEALAASRLAALTDVSGLQASARQHLDKVVAPELLSAAIAQGQGRSGAGLEAIAKAGAQFALPIEQARIAAQNRLADWFTNRGDLRTQLAANVSNPASMSFMAAPTETRTLKQPGFGWGDAIGLGLTIAGASMPGGGSLLGNAMGSLFPSLLGTAASGSPAWNIPLMAARYAGALR